MKHHDDGRPIGKCKGCCLNYKTICAAGLGPKHQWRHGRCNRYGDAKLLAEVLEKTDPVGSELARLKRKAKAAEAGTSPHHNEVLDPAKMAGRAKRHR